MEFYNQIEWIYSVAGKNYIDWYCYSLASIVGVQTRKKQRKKRAKVTKKEIDIMMEMKNSKKGAWIAVLFCFVLFCFVMFIVSKWSFVVVGCYI